MKPLNFNLQHRNQHIYRDKPIFSNPRRNIININQFKNDYIADKENTQDKESLEEVEMTDMALHRGHIFDFSSYSTNSNRKYSMDNDISSLLQKILPNEIDPSPLHNVYPYEYRIDASGIIYQMITNPYSISFPRELEYRDLSNRLKWYHYPMYHLLNLDPLDYFELSLRRTKFYVNPWYYLQFEMNEDEDDEVFL